MVRGVHIPWMLWGLWIRGQGLSPLACTSVTGGAARVGMAPSSVLCTQTLGVGTAPQHFPRTASPVGKGLSRKLLRCPTGPGGLQGPSPCCLMEEGGHCHPAYGHRIGMFPSAMGHTYGITWGCQHHLSPRDGTYSIHTAMNPLSANFLNTSPSEQDI